MQFRVRQLPGFRLQGVGFLVNEAKEKVHSLQPVAKDEKFSRGQVAHWVG